MTADPEGGAVLVASPLGALSIRPQRDADAPELFALFCQSRPELDLLPLDAAGRLEIKAMQFRAQAAGYAAQFPAARFDVVELAGSVIGRLVVERTGAALQLIDIALTPQARGQGVGAALLRALMAQARAAGLPMRLSVSTDNPDAQRLYLRLGFAPTGRSPTHVSMEWRATGDMAKQE